MVVLAAIATVGHELIVGRLQANAWPYTWSDIIKYVFLGPTLVCFLAALIDCFAKDRIGCLSVLPVVVLVYAAEIIIFVRVRGFHWALLAPLFVVAGLFVVMGGPGQLVDKYRRKTCAKCGQPSRFALTSTKPTTVSDKETKLCYAHFFESLSASLKRYHGQFVIVDRQREEKTKSGQYFFYAPDDLLEDSYPQSDVEAVNELLDSAFGDLPATSFEAVRIPADATGRILQDEGPLLLATDKIKKTPMDLDELLYFLKLTLADFDVPGCQFTMNKPYTKRGIYLWHNYT